MSELHTSHTTCCNICRVLRKGRHRTIFVSPCLLQPAQYEFINLIESRSAFSPQTIKEIQIWAGRESTLYLLKQPSKSHPHQCLKAVNLDCSFCESLFFRSCKTESFSPLNSLQQEVLGQLVLQCYPQAPAKGSHLLQWAWLEPAAKSAEVWCELCLINASENPWAAP